VDFSLSEVQVELQDLAENILTDNEPTAQQRHEAKGEWFDLPVWKTFAEQGLTGAAIPEEFGGSGLSFLEICAVLIRVGAHGARVPFLANTVLGAMPIVRFGSNAQRKEWLPKIADGSALVTAALVEPNTANSEKLGTVAIKDGSGWKLSGQKMFVPAAHLASRILVTARVEPDQIIVCLVDPKASGVKLSQVVAATGEPEGVLTLRDVAISASDVLGTPETGANIAKWMTERATVGVCAMQLGVGEESLKLTANWTTQRKQFGRPLSSFPVVGFRAAEAYMSVEGSRLAMWRAASLLAEEREAADDVAIAKYWAAESSNTVVTEAHRLHGGMGVDMTYPLGRLSLLARQLEFSFGSARHQLSVLGKSIADATRNDKVGRL